MSAFTPPKPAPLGARPGFLGRARAALRSGISFFLDGSYETGVGRHRLPQLPGTPERCAYSVRDPELMRHVLVERAADFPKSRLMAAMLEELTGPSIFTTNGAVWARQRAMIDPSFENARLRDVLPLMRDAGDALIGRLAAHAGTGRPAPIDIEATHVAADIIFRTIYSVPIEGEAAHRIFRAFETFQGLAYAHGMMGLAGLPEWLMPGRGRARRAAREIRAELARPLAARFARAARGETGGEVDLLASLMTTPDPGSGETFSEAELLDHISTLFLAGHETSAAALGWTLYMIAKCPHVQDRMRAEAQAVLGDRPPEFADMKRLGFIRDVFREALRLYPPVAFLARDAACPVRLGKRDVPAGATVFVPQWLLHRNRQIWADADVFDPDRFETENGRAGARTAWFPFSLGPRVCVGAAFALQEAALVLAMLVRAYRFAPAPGVPEPEPVARLTLRSATGIHLIVEPA